MTFHHPDSAFSQSLASCEAAIEDLKSLSSPSPIHFPFGPATCPVIRHPLSVNAKRSHRRPRASKQATAPADALWTIDRAAGYLALSERHIRRMVERGELVAYRIGRALRFRRSDLDQIVSPVEDVTVATDRLDAFIKQQITTKRVAP